MKLHAFRLGALLVIVLLAAACRSTSEDNRTFKPFFIKVDGERWRAQPPGGREYATSYVPPDQAVIISLSQFRDDGFKMDISDAQLLAHYLAVERRYIDSAITANKVADLTTDVGEFPLYRFTTYDPPALRVLYRATDGSVIDVGFDFEDNREDAQNIVSLINKMYRAKLLSRKESGISKPLSF